jgi:uncharacterized Tic20 family protein
MTQDPNTQSGAFPPGGPDPAGTPPGYIPPSGVPGEYSGQPTKDEQTMAMLCYILGIFGLFGWLGPLIIWLTKKDTSPFVRDQGKEVLNWEFTILIFYLVGIVTWCFVIGMVIVVATLITNLVLCILGAVKVSKGIPYRMPFSIKFIK